MLAVKTRIVIIKMLVFSLALARAQHILGLGTQREKESGLPRSAHLRGDPIPL